MQAAKTYIERIKKLNRPTVVVLFVCLALVTINLCIAQHTYSYDSDDVSWQTTLLTWSPFSGQTAYVGAKDNFFINVPFIYLFEHVFKITRAQLLVEAIFFALVNFILFYIACIYFLKKVGIKPTFITLVPFIWLASFGSGLTTSFLNTNWRDYEFGVSFIFYMLAAKYYYGEIATFTTVKSRLILVALLGFAAIYTYSDPYFFYFTLFPITGWFFTLWTLKKVTARKLLVVTGFSLVALFLSRFCTTMLARAGILAPHGVIKLTGLGNLHRTLDMLVNSLESIFSINFSKNILVSLGNVVLLVVILFVTFALRRRIQQQVPGGSEPGLAVKVFFTLLGIASIAAYIAIGNGAVGNSRYLVLFVYISALLIALNMNSLGRVSLRLLVAAVLATALFNTTSAFVQIQSSSVTAEEVNGSNYRLIDTIRRLGYTKGYAGYWDSDINTYLSKDSINFLPVTCSADNVSTRPLPLLVNGGLFSQPAKKTFYVVDPTNTSPKMCSEDHVINQFGQPNSEVKVGHDTILLYDYDLVSQMPYVP